MADNKERKQKQVSLASTAGVSKKRKKKKKMTTGMVVIRVMVVVLVILSLLFIGVLAFGIISSFQSGGNKHEVQLYSYDTTPESQTKKVSYFLVGVTGKDESSPMDMLSLVCYDKNAKAVRILQVPVDSYLGNSGNWTVSRIGNVWTNPTPLTWCETCRKRVFEPEQENNKHTVCGTPLTEKTGSAVECLTAVFNDQFSMPVDNYFILSQETLVSMVDLMGGIDVELENAMKVGEIQYSKGKAVLDGAAALYYAHGYDFNGTPQKDLLRLPRQRKVWTAMLQRMATMGEEKLYDAVISTVMAGATPIRTETDGKAVARMLAGIHSGSTENVTFAKGLCKLIGSFRKVDLSNATFHILPGTVAKQGSATYYSISRDKTLELLQGKFNPYGLEMQEEHLQITPLPTAGKAEIAPEQAMAEIAVEQSVATTAAPTTAATTAAPK